MKNKVIQYALTHNLSLSEAFDHFNVSEKKGAFVRACKRLLRKSAHGDAFIDCFLKKGSTKNKKIQALLVCDSEEITPLATNNEQVLHLIKKRVGPKEYQLLYNKLYRHSPKLAKIITSQKKGSSPCIKNPFDLHEQRFI